MKESQSITNNLLMEVDVLSNRLRNIKQSYKTTENKALRGRLFAENKNIFKRVNEIHKIAELLNKNNEKRMVAMMTSKYRIITIVVPILT